MTTDPTKIRAAQQRTDKISTTFCMAKWHHVTFYLHQGMTHSCYHCQVHAIDLEAVKKDIRAFHNTEHKKHMRKLMLNGERPIECEYCWNIEDLDGEHFSDRHYRNAEDWSQPYIEQTGQMNWDADPWPHYVEISFTNHCNLKCSYCCPGASSRWYTEIQKEGDYPTDNLQYSINNLNMWHEDLNPYIDAFWEWLPHAYEHLHVLRFTGGEPLLSKNVYKVMDYINENPNPKMEFNVNSNLSVPAKNVDKFIDNLRPMLDKGNIRNFIMFTSIDTWGKQAEWARNGLDVELWKRNLETYLERVPEGQVAFMVTFHLNSFTNLKALLEYVNYLRETYNVGENRIFLDTPYLLEPDHLTPFLAPESYLEYIDECLEYMRANPMTEQGVGFSQTDINGLKRVYNWVKGRMKTEPEAEKNKNRAQFYIFAEEHDRRRGTNFVESFPEMADFYAECKSLAEEIYG
jgi:hypothetical protein